MIKTINSQILEIHEKEDSADGSSVSVPGQLSQAPHALRLQTEPLHLRDFKILERSFLAQAQVR